MPSQILLDNTAVGWRDFADQLMRFQALVQTDATFAYIVTSQALRRETQTLCRHLGIEDYTYLLEQDEAPPSGLQPAGTLDQEKEFPG
jgi:hypothetical protein